MELFKLAGAKNNSQAIEALLDKVQQHKDFYMLLIGSVSLAIVGLMAGSIPILIASMITASLAYPILALGLDLTTRDWRLSFYMLMLLVVACLLALAVSVGATLLFNDVRMQGIYAIVTENNLVAGAIAIIMGGVAVYGFVRPRVAAVMTGVTIGVILALPLIAAAIGLSANDNDLTSKASTLFLLNVVGVLLASMIVSRLFNMRREYYPQYN